MNKISRDSYVSPVCDVLVISYNDGVCTDFPGFGSNGKEDEW